ncbi:MAG: hypothetical protein AcusKO_25750 [Acuticoccus sp.]
MAHLMTAKTLPGPMAGVLGLVAIAGMAAGSGEAAAQGRPSTLDMTCQAAQEYVKQRGAATLSTGPRTYDRFVARRSDCKRRNTRLEPVWVPSKDKAQCALQQCRGYGNSDGNR